MRRLLSGVTALAVAATLMLVTAPAEAATRYVVTATASTAKLDVGQSFTLKGKVTPKAKGQRVKVQRLTGSGWTTIKKPYLNRRSRYTATIKVTIPGDNRYRVVKPRANGHKKGISPTVTVVGWRWRSLTSMPILTTLNATVLASGLIGENVFRPYVKLGSPGGGAAVIGYILGGNCSRFDAHVGVAPDSVSEDAQVALLRRSTLASPGDYQTISQAFIHPGQDPIHMMRGPDAVTQWATVAFSSPGLTANNYVGWGDAKVYCRS